MHESYVSTRQFTAIYVYRSSLVVIGGHESSKCVAGNPLKGLLETTGLGKSLLLYGHLPSCKLVYAGFIPRANSQHSNLPPQYSEYKCVCVFIVHIDSESCTRNRANKFDIRHINRNAANGIA